MIKNIIILLMSALWKFWSPIFENKEIDILFKFPFRCHPHPFTHQHNLMADILLATPVLHMLSPSSHTRFNNICRNTRSNNKASLNTISPQMRRPPQLKHRQSTHPWCHQLCLLSLQRFFYCFLVFILSKSWLPELRSAGTNFFRTWARPV